QVTRPAIEVAGSQEDLRRRRPEASEVFLVSPHQVALPDGGTRLQVGKIGRALAQSQAADTGPDGTGADERNLPARLAATLNLVGKGGHASRVEDAVGTGEDVGPYLDNHGVGQGNNFLTDRIDHGNGASYGQTFRQPAC